MNFRNTAIYTLYAILIIPVLIFSSHTAQAFEINKVVSFRILLSLLVIISSIYVIKRKELDVSKFFGNKKLVVLGGLFLLALIISTLFSVSPHVSFFGSYARHQGLYTYLHYFFLFFLVLLLSLNKKEVQKILIVIISTASLVSIYALLQKANLDFLISANTDEFLGRVFSTFGHPNFFGQYLLLTIPISIGLLFQFAKKRWIWLFSFLLILQSFALFFTHNRASFLGLFIGILCFFFIYFSLQKRNPFKKWFYSIASLLILLPIIVNILPNDTFLKTVPGVDRMILYEENLRSIQSRIHIFPNVAEFIFESPIYGYGLETFSFVYPQKMDTELLQLEHFYKTPDRAHNEILDTAFQTGVLGLIILLLLYFFSIKRGIDYFRTKEKNYLVLGLSCSILSIFFANQFGFPVTIHSLHFFLFIALLISVTTSKEKYICTNKYEYVVPTFLIIAALINIFINIELWQADRHLIEAQKAMMRNNQEITLQELDMALYKNDISNEYKLFIANYYYNTQQKDLIVKGFSLLKTVEERNDHLPELYMMKGKLYSYLDAKKDMHNAYKKAHELAPVDPRILRDWGDMSFNLKDYEAAIDAYLKLIEISPPYWQWSDNELESKSEYEKTKHRLFFKHNPQFKQMFYYLSESYNQIGNSEKAQYYLQFFR